MDKAKLFSFVLFLAILAGTVFLSGCSGPNSEAKKMYDEAINKLAVNQIEAAKEAFSRIVATYPDSPAAQDAREKLKMLEQDEKERQASAPAPKKGPATGPPSTVPGPGAVPGPDIEKAEKVLQAVVETTLPPAGSGSDVFVETITMNNPAYPKHAKSLVKFSHAKHSDAYGYACGDCHHDEKGAAIQGLKKGDKVLPCMACHPTPKALTSKEKKLIKALGEQQARKKLLAFHAEAMHMQCIDCHKAWNKENGKSSKDGAPTSCTKCHRKTGDS